MRLRQEKQRKLDEHRQRVAALQQAEYIAYDEERARAADELEWLDFETRMVGVVKQMIEPALLLSIEDREQNIELGCALEKQAQRIELLEKAVYRKTGGTTSIFDDFERKIQDMGTHVKQQSAQLRHD